MTRPATSEVRKHIPVKTKLAVLIAQARCARCGERLLADPEFDHDPALVHRRWDEAAGDYDPPQLDPKHMRAVHKDCHLEKTTGRKPGAERTVTTRGSDIGEAAHGRRVRQHEEEFRRRLLAKDAGEVEEEKSRWPKRQWPKRQRPKLRQKRPWPKRRAATGTA